ncbi:MAG: hypothetical protein HQ567_22785 [Candidatus Nealsonbacteria bacterium]|nr:hypothetical protein [Candidatus Nealsonbacteria bacterium]
MRRTSFVPFAAGCFLVVLWAGAVVAQDAATPPTEPNRPAMAGPSAARALLLIQSDPDTFAVDAETISLLLYTWHGRRDVSFQSLPGGSPGNSFGVLEYTGEGDGTKTLEEVVGQLREVLTRLAQPSIERSGEQREQAMMRRDRAEESVARLEEDLSTIRKEMARMGGPPEALAEQARALRSQRLVLRAELEGLSAQREQLVKQIAAVRDEVADAGKQSEAVREQLETILKLKEKEIARLRALRAQKAISEGEVEKAEMAFAVAQVELAKWRQDVARQADGDRLSALNIQLVETETGIVVAESRLVTLERSLAELTDSSQAKTHQAYDRVRRELAAELAELEAATKSLFATRGAQQSSRMPRVLVLGRDGKLEEPER